MQSLEAKIDVAINEIKHIKDYIERKQEEFDRHVLESRAYREKVLRLENVRSKLDDHIYWDRVIQGSFGGLVAAVVVAALLKFFNLT